MAAPTWPFKWQLRSLLSPGCSPRRPDWFCRARAFNQHSQTVPPLPAWLLTVQQGGLVCSHFHGHTVPGGEPHCRSCSFSTASSRRLDSSWMHVAEAARGKRIRCLSRNRFVRGSWLPGSKVTLPSIPCNPLGPGHHFLAARRVRSDLCVFPSVSQPVAGMGVWWQVTLAPRPCGKCWRQSSRAPNGRGHPPSLELL